MVCRSTPGNSGITSLARHNSGLLDVQVLSMFHEVRASVPRDMPSPRVDEVFHFQDQAASRVRAAVGLPDRERNQMFERIRSAHNVMPDGRTYYAWRNIEAATQRAARAMDTHFQQLADTSVGDIDAERYRNAFNQLMRRDHRIGGEVPRAPENVDYFTENVPRDRGTRYALAMLHAGAVRAVERGDTEELERIYREVHEHSLYLAENPHLNPANNCPDCGQFAGSDHVCPHTAALNDSHLGYVAAQSHQSAGRSMPSEAADAGSVTVVERPALEPSYVVAGFPGLRGLTQRLTRSGDNYVCTDGQVLDTLSGAVRHERNLVMMDNLRTAIRTDHGASGIGDVEAAHIIDSARTRIIERGVDFITSDNRAFTRLDQALYHQFRRDNTPDGVDVVARSENGEPYARCADCGQYADTNHACPPSTEEQTAMHALAEWERELLEAAEQQAVESAARMPEVANVIADVSAARQPARPAANATPSADPATESNTAASAPVRTRNPNRTYRTDDGGSVRMMNVSAVRATPAGETVEITDVAVILADQTNESGTTYPGLQVTGSVTVTNTGLRRTRNRDRYTVAAGERSLRCHCPQYRDNYDCVHVREAVERIQATLNDREPVAVAPAQAMEAVAADLRGEYDASLAAAEQSRAAFAEGNTGVSYAESMAAFQTVWDEAKAHFESGQTALPYMIENATNGLGARNGGRSFGLEIEIDFPDDMSFTAKERVAREIFEAGLSDSPEVRPWHWRARQMGPRGQRFGGGYTDNPNMWSVEFDRSVDDVGGQRGCELVSPILYDTPETWRNLQKILEIVERNGGKATPRTGLHVNVGARDYDHTVENHNRLIGLANGYEDVIVRAAHNPQAGSTHRGREYCRPMAMPSEGYTSIRAAQRGIDPRSHDGSSHRAMINLDHVPAEGGEIQNSTRVEVRIFDGSTDAGRIQMSTKLALAVVDAAQRGVEAPEVEERAGTHRARNTAANGRARRLRGEEWENDTRSFREFADLMFTRPEDKRQLAFAFASSRWQAA